jgi:hypothetical protein
MFWNELHSPVMGGLFPCSDLALSLSRTAWRFTFASFPNPWRVFDGNAEPATGSSNNALADY